MIVSPCFYGCMRADYVYEHEWIGQLKDASISSADDVISGRARDNTILKGYFSASDAVAPPPKCNGFCDRGRFHFTISY